MKIVTWNMGYNNDASQHGEAWRYLIEELQPDIALLQEVVIPDDVRTSHVCIFTPPTQPVWGSAVIVLDRKAVQVDLPAASLLHRFRSRLTVASVDVDGASTLVASVHPSTRKVDSIMLEGVDRAAVATPSGELWEADILYAGLRELTAAGGRFIFGGDWMETWLWDRKHGTKNHGQFFDRAAADGWVESTSRCFGVSEIDLRTWYGRRGGKSTPYQLDRIFLDRQLADCISNCDVISHPAQHLKLSDHAPLVLELSLATDTMTAGS